VSFHRHWFTFFVVDYARLKSFNQKLMDQNSSGFPGVEPSLV